VIYADIRIDRRGRPAPGLRRRGQGPIPGDRRRLRKAIAISSNIHPSGFDELMPKSTATATVDRLLHHVPCPDHRTPGQHLARASDRRQGGETPDLNPPAAPTGGEKSWPPVGGNHGRGWGERWPWFGRGRWPLTVPQPRVLIAQPRWLLALVLAQPARALVPAPPSPA
jgi:hypothetical protein